MDLISYDIEMNILHIMTKKVHTAVVAVKFNHFNIHFAIEKMHIKVSSWSEVDFMHIICIIFYDSYNIIFKTQSLK